MTVIPSQSRSSLGDTEHGKMVDHNTTQHDPTLKFVHAVSCLANAEPRSVPRRHDTIPSATGRCSLFAGADAAVSVVHAASSKRSLYIMTCRVAFYPIHSIPRSIRGGGAYTYTS